MPRGAPPTSGDNGVRPCSTTNRWPNNLALGDRTMALSAAPSAENHFLAEHAALILVSHHHWTGRHLVGPTLHPVAAAQALYEAPFAILSHDDSGDPRFTYANLCAQQLFELPWGRFIGMPSRYSAEPVERAERERLLARVSAHGFVDDYTGVRVASSGKRFLVRNATVWNLVDRTHRFCGQAACLREWQFVDQDDQSV